MTKKRGSEFVNVAILLTLLAWGSGAPAVAQISGSGTVRGTITLAERGTPLHHATVVLAPLGRMAESGEDGTYSFSDVPPGKYSVIAHLHALSDEKQVVTVESGKTVEANFALHLAAVRESVTVTATGRGMSAQESIEPVVTLEGFELTTRSSSTSLGDLLEYEPGIAKRSGGPGSTRPVVRGFDGDRVLVLQDGIRTGTLSSQSGDHGEPVDATAVDRVEVVKGPATLMYGSNAIGGVVNILTAHHIMHQHPHEGLHLNLNAVGGTTNGQGGGSGNFEYGKKQWLLYGGGGGMRTGDYNTPIGRIFNSYSDLRHANAGFGRFGEKFAWNLTYGRQDGEYGVPYQEEEDHHQGAKPAAAFQRLPGGLSLRPFGEEDDDHHDHGPVALRWRRHNLRGNFTAKQLGGFLESFTMAVNYSDWNHKEIELEENVIGTEFFNKQFIYRGTFTQRRRGPLSGSFGFWGMHRDFKAVGEEALAPPTTQNAFALFALEELNYDRIRFQFGGRFERNAYNPDELRSRSFNGVSASAGALVPLWTNGSASFNYMHSFRAPALEELYNNGPHPGNAFFEVGNPNLRRERGDGVDLSIRHQARRVRLETNFFRYQMHDFVYLQPTGEVEDGLPVGNYEQADARFLGVEARSEFGLTSSLWLLTGIDAVDAHLTGTRQNLPRIPPVRGRLGFDYRWRGLSMRPELVLANRQWQIAPNEEATAGFAVVNLTGSYTVTRQHTMHIFSAQSFNLGDRVYRNHLNFLKSFAPEIGRGIRFGYSFHWF